MEKKHLKTLKLLEAIEKQSYSQRQLSKKINISLGLVNKFINDLEKQGALKIANNLKSRTEYTLTPKGVEEKTKLKIQHIAHSIDFYKKIKVMISERLRKFNGNNESHLVFYGANELSEIACVLLSQGNYNKVKIIDEKKAGKIICGIKIDQETELDNMTYDTVVIMEIHKYNNMRDKLIGKGVPSDKIITIVPEFL